MSYTRPAANAANFSWSAALAYARPAANAANFSFVTSFTATASGFRSTQFGVPLLGNHAASGFTSTQFGTGKLTVVTYGAGFTSTLFGTPVADAVTAVQAAGFSSTQFGAPNSVDVAQATGFSSTQFGTPALPATDPYIDDVVLLAHFDGANGSTAPALDATGRHTVAFANGAQLKTTRPVFGSAAAEMSSGGVGGPYVDISGNLADFDFGNGDFTIEFRVQWDGVNAGWSTASILQARVNSTLASTGTSFSVEINTASTPYALNFRAVGGATSAGGTTAWRAAFNDGSLPATGTTFAVSVERFGGSMYAYINGVCGATVGAIGTNYINPLSTSGAALRIGVGGQNDGFNGMIDELRVTKGVARRAGASSYSLDTAAFPDPVFTTPPTTAGFPDGFSSTQFGTGKLTVVTYGAGFTSTLFGVPSGVQLTVAPSIGRTTHFGVPSTPTNRTFAAAGWQDGGLGLPLVIRFLPPNTSHTALALQFRGTRFGLPVAAKSINVQAVGTCSTAFGTPGTQFTPRMLAAGFSVGGFGVPYTLAGFRATGFRTGVLGTPVGQPIFQVAPFVPKTRFGTPSCAWPSARIARGIWTTRFGQPSGKSVFPHAVSGFRSGGVGTPASQQVHRVMHLPPGTRFGVPLLRRNPSC